MIFKEVLPHEEAHTFVEAVSPPHHRRCSCCAPTSHFSPPAIPSTIHSAQCTTTPQLQCFQIGAPNSSRRRRVFPIPLPFHRTSITRNLFTTNHASSAPTTADIQFAANNFANHRESLSPQSLLSSPSESVSASVILARYRARCINDVCQSPNSAPGPDSGVNESSVIVASPSNLQWHADDGSDQILEDDFRCKENDDKYNIFDREMTNEQIAEVAGSCESKHAEQGEMLEDSPEDERSHENDPRQHNGNCVDLCSNTEEQPTSTSNNDTIVMDHPPAPSTSSSLDCHNDLPLCPVCLSNYEVGESVAW